MPKKRSSSKKNDPIEILHEYCKTVAFISLDSDLLSGSGPAQRLSVSLMPDLDSDSILVLVDINAFPQDDHSNGEEQICFGISTENRFRVTNLKRIVKLQENGFELQTWMVATVLGTAVGVTKGVLLAKLADTKYAQLPLPIFSMKEFIPDNTAEMIPFHGI